MKRIVCLILALLMLTPTAFADTPQMTYRLKGGEGKVGDVVKVVLSVEEAPACVAYETTLTYDPAVLQPTGDYQKMHLNGLMVVNTEADIEGKKMVKVAAVAVKGNLLEGTTDLLNISFKIIGTPEDAQGSLIDVYDYTFSQDDEKLTPVPTLLLVPARVRVAEGGTLTEPAPEKEEEKKEEQGGDWYFDGDQAIEYYPDNSEESVQYDAEYEKDKDGNTTGVILYNKEDKTEAGRLEVEEDEYGNLNVTDKQMNDEDEGKKKNEEPSFSLWYLIPIGAAVLIAVGGVILAIKTKKKN
ncbi:MAG: hypothetical protein IKK30_05040 [Clostridia bacterium]|nr:hypothetical protein [Clostridia bacterium]